MLQNHFYHKLTRKYITAFGTLFNDIHVHRDALSTGIEIERLKVPIRYGSKERWLERIQADPDLRNHNLTLPLITFQDVGYSYDPQRKINPVLRNVAGSTSTQFRTQYTGAPWNIDFELTVWGKTTTDADQIVEQILPTFNPEYNIPAVPIDDMGFVKDIPLVLTGVTKEVNEEGGTEEEIRTVKWTLSFTMKVYFWGPVSNTGLIRTVFANTYLDPALQSGAIVRMNLTDPGNNGDFKLEDTIYQGSTLETSNAAAIVLHWDATNHYIRVGGAQGQFKVGQTIRAAQTNAAYTISSFDATPLKLASIKIEPDPIDAEPSDDFGYTETYIEYPQTLDE